MYVIRIRRRHLRSLREFAACGVFSFVGRYSRQAVAGSVFGGPCGGRRRSWSRQRLRRFRRFPLTNEPHDSFLWRLVAVRRPRLTSVLALGGSGEEAWPGWVWLRPQLVFRRSFVRRSTAFRLIRWHSRRPGHRECWFVPRGLLAVRVERRSGRITRPEHLDRLGGPCGRL
jgi:hypothetical protein